MAEAALALDANGQFLALRVKSAANVGAYMVSAGGVQTFQYVHLPGTVYRIPAIGLEVAGVLTNTAPIGVTRGPGFAEAVNIIERLIDAAARQCGFDRAELRRMQHGPGGGDACHQRRWQHRRQRRLCRDLRPRAGARRCRGLSGPPPRERGAWIVARSRLCLSHQGDRRLTHRKCRHPLRGGRHRVVDHRHPDHRARPRDDVSADPRRPARHPERAYPAGAGRHRPDPAGRRARQLARHLYGRHGDLARL